MFRIGRKNKGSGVPGRVGIALTHDGFALCHVVRGEEPQAKLVRVHHVSGLTTEERTEALAGYVEQNGLAETSCVVILSPEDYTLRLVDRPNVEEDEIAASLPFLIKDVIDFDPADAQIAYFPLPEDANRGRDARLFVGVARKECVAEVTALTEAANLELEAIDIAELALRNIVGELPEQVAGTAMLDLGPKGGLLALCHEEQFYFSRSLGAGTLAIDNVVGSQISLEEESGDELSQQVRSLLDELLLEIQRSLDYYESELGKAPASRLVIAPSESEVSLYVPYLSEQLRPVVVEQIDLNSIVDHDSVLRNDVQTRILLALGAGLRGESHQQIDLRPPVVAPPSTMSLPFEMIAPLCGGIMVVLFGLYVLALQNNAALETQVEGARSRVAAMTNHNASLEDQIKRAEQAQYGIDPLVQEKASRDASARRLRALESLGGGRREGFSRYFEGFAKRPVKDLWIERIEVHDGGASLSIKGKTFEAARVPQLLRKLSNESSFEGKSFSIFELQSNEDENALSFALESEPTDPTAETMR